jgi:sortase A
MRTAVGWIGRVLLVSGILLLLFVAYQLWGTGILQSRDQDNLRNQFDASTNTAGTTTPGTTTPGTTRPTGTPTAATGTTVDNPTVPASTPAVPPNGDALAEIKIAKIDVDQIVVEGVDVPDLRKGPGHYPVTPTAGQEGNMAIAGHRTTYNAPFGDLDQLATGDTITVTGLDHVTWTYKVNKDPFAVDPSDGSVLDAVPDLTRPGHAKATLTLTTCNPKYSAAQRLIVQADLLLPAGQVPLPAAHIDPTRARATISGLEGDSGSRFPTIVWGIVAALVGAGWWFLFRRWKKWYVWIVGAIPFLVVLFVFYTYLERLLPSNY